MYRGLSVIPPAGDKRSPKRGFAWAWSFERVDIIDFFALLGYLGRYFGQGLGRSIKRQGVFFF